MIRPLLRSCLLMLPLLLAMPAARAAQDYDNCTGFIDALPATITTPGTWCLRGHRYTSISSGHAVLVDASNVTIDCNHFRVSGLGAGNTSNAFGITVNAGRSGAVVRRCRVQGFATGIVLLGSGGRAEDNAIDRSLYTGLQVGDGNDNLVRRNVITDTGGYAGYGFAYGIYANGGAGSQFIDNIIRGVDAAPDSGGNKYATGLHMGNGGVARGNRISGLVRAGTYGANGITAIGGVVRDNVIMQAATTQGYGVTANQALCQDNTSQGFEVGYVGCILAGSNASQP